MILPSEFSGSVPRPPPFRGISPFPGASPPGERSHGAAWSLPCPTAPPNAISCPEECHSPHRAGCSLVHLGSGSGFACRQQSSQLVQDFRGSRARKLAYECRPPSAPIKTLDLIRQHHSTHLEPGWNTHFKRVALHLTGNRAENRKADFSVVRSRRDHQSWTSASLFMTDLRAQRDPNDVPTAWDIPACHYQDSLPTEGPESTSP